MIDKIKSKVFLIISIIFFIIFILFIILLKNIDVKETGVENTVVGLSSINFYFRDKIGVTKIWNTITECIGIIGIVVAFCFAMVGLYQWIKRKNMFKVDFEILMLGVLYLIVIGTYFFFEKKVINYRPIILDKDIEASFPSSHTFTACTIMLTAIPLFNKYLKDKRKLNIALNIFSILVVVITIFGRIISGVHWFTDIVCGIVLTIALTSLYYFVIKLKKSC